MIDKKYLAKKHTGMKVSANGLLGRIRDGWKIGELIKRLEDIGIKVHLKKNLKRLYKLEGK